MREDDGAGAGALPPSAGRGAGGGLSSSAGREPADATAPSAGRGPADATAPSAGRGPADATSPSAGRGRARRGLTFLVVAALAASAGVCTTIAVRNAVAAGRGGPGLADAAVAGGSAALNDESVYDKVAPGIVDVSSNMRYLEETAEGTGVVIDAAAGLVLTNNHVIDGATSVTVTPVLSGKSYSAEVLGYDSSDDVALLRLRGVPGLRAVAIGDSSRMTVGTPVLAIGNEAGQGGSPTVAPGVIGSLDRTIKASDQSSGFTETLHNMLQTSADIRPGDSGGPLADAAGRVIGINTAAAGSGPGGHAGYAVPINKALSIADQIAAGRASRTVHIGLPAFLGVLVPDSTSTNPVRQASQERLRAGTASSSSLSCLTGGPGPYFAVPGSIAPAQSGALVTGVLCGTPAADAGVAAGDVITALGGRPVTSPGSLTAMIAKYRPGGKAWLAWVSPGGTGHQALVTLNSGPAG
jgi:S1-C subfamily serine protease